MTKLRRSEMIIVTAGAILCGCSGSTREPRTQVELPSMLGVDQSDWMCTVDSKAMVRTHVSEEMVRSSATLALEWKVNLLSRMVGSALSGESDPRKQIDEIKTEDIQKAYQLLDSVEARIECRQISAGGEVRTVFYPIEQ